MSGFDLAFTSALIDFVWQGTLVAVALQVALYTARTRSAQLRYGLSAAALLVLMALPIVTTLSRYDRGNENHGEGFTATHFTVVGTDDTRRVADVHPRHPSA